MFRIFLTILCLLFTETLQETYILNNEKCKIPDLEILNEDVRDIIQPNPYIPCNKTELLTHVTKNGPKFELHLREDLFPQYFTQNITCCYSYVTRNGSVELPDVGISISPCVPFHKKIVLEQDIVKVVCRDNNQSVVYENVHVTIKPSKPLKNTSQPFSVLFVVVDSISRLNFHRTMPETANFLKKRNFIEMKAYSKVNDNTFPNCMALLTGFSLSQSYQHCNPHKKSALDNCPMIWKDFHQHGYTTAYAEDNSRIATFNYLKKGFTNPPTDFYFKPYMEATETLRIQHRHSMPFCTGPESAGERILNLAKDFAITFKHNPSFGIFWMNTFSHDDVNAPFTMDAKLSDFFRDLDEAGVLDESFVFLLSDHGIRFGPMVGTNSGWLEGRMPLNMISVPAKFKREFGREYENLKQNSGKLTNTYDMFMTLQHILTLGGVRHEVRPSQGCPNCVSLFDPIPDRSCQEAAIPYAWCPCFGRLKTLNPFDVQSAITYTLSKAKSEILAQCDIDNLDPHVDSVSVSEPDHEKNQILFVVFHVESAIGLATVKFKDVVTEKSLFYFRFIYLYNICKQDNS
ncbi:uncharacterized protein LOC659120 [Tribolium castaneum]|uniref:DUF229 domain containing protein n=1 Tax=Tribolium castaneum TaxID=7070 RepID=D6X0G3_TRICA|nr:PREDICTED: uncharacterized protein LOC659120 [Tribolium castaneum]EFA10540.1 hypothetical protein TcasGA2_TC012795 [Tribolium castaneum]|eukprot:XP_970545.1 PREDICTED: uncharacterized protein LOC659120 [Tribolium castaneum]